MASRPTDYLDWGGTQTQPTAPQKATGFTPDFRPPAQWHNWMFGNIDAWIKWFDENIEAFAGYQAIYAAFVGTGPLATHADLNAAIADVPAGSRILILSSATINTVQSISKNNITVEFQPGVVYSKGTAQYALQVQADFVTIIGGQFQGFSGGGNAAIRVDANADFTKILNSHFKTNATDVDDLGVDTVIAQTTTEA